MGKGHWEKVPLPLKAKMSFPIITSGCAPFDLELQVGRWVFLKQDNRLAPLPPSVHSKVNIILIPFCTPFFSSLSSLHSVSPPFKPYPTTPPTLHTSSSSSPPKTKPLEPFPVSFSKTLSLVLTSLQHQTAQSTPSLWIMSRVLY